MCVCVCVCVCACACVCVLGEKGGGGTPVSSVGEWVVVLGLPSKVVSLRI